MNGEVRVRIDKWLWAARLFKTRALATEAIDFGRVRVDGKRVRPGREARLGEVVDVCTGELRREFVIRAVSTVRGPASAAQQMYEETAASLARRERCGEQRRYGAEPASSIKGRPTKREGRMLRAVRQDDTGAK